MVTLLSPYLAYTMTATTMTATRYTTMVTAMKTWKTNGVLVRNHQIHSEFKVIPPSANMFVAVVVIVETRYIYQSEVCTCTHRCFNCCFHNLPGLAGGHLLKSAWNLRTLQEIVGCPSGHPADSVKALRPHFTLPSGRACVSCLALSPYLFGFDAVHNKRWGTVRKFVREYQLLLHHSYDDNS